MNIGRHHGTISLGQIFIIFSCWTSIVLFYGNGPSPAVFAETAVDETTGTFLWFSDIHLDPFYGMEGAAGKEYCRGSGDSTTNDTTPLPIYGKVGCDSPRLLIEEALQMIYTKTIEQPPDFIVVTGDICRHDNDQFEHPIHDTMMIQSNVSSLLRSTFPETFIIPSIGNNDLVPDYYIDSENATLLLKSVAEGLDPLFESDRERKTFSRGGYFARNVSDTITVLSLNTVIYSTNHIPDQASYLNDPLGQLHWLKHQLKIIQESHRVAYIIGHIPPAIGSYRHSQLWSTKYLMEYYSILSKYNGNSNNNYSSVIAGQLFGHLHSDEFRLTNIHQQKYPLLLAPSITPIYGSNPSVRMVRYKPDTGELMDYETYYLDLSQIQYDDNELLVWDQSPSFQKSFQVSNLSSASLDWILNNLTSSIHDSSSSTLWDALLTRQHVQAHDDDNDMCDTPSCRIEWICTLQSINKSDYEACRRKYFFQSASVRFIGVVSLLIFLGLLVIGIQQTLRYWKRRDYYEAKGDALATTSYNAHEGEIVLQVHDPAGGGFMS